MSSVFCLLSSCELSCELSCHPKAQTISEDTVGIRHLISFPRHYVYLSLVGIRMDPRTIEFISHHITLLSSAVGTMLVNNVLVDRWMDKTRRKWYLY